MNVPSHIRKQMKDNFLVALGIFVILTLWSIMKPVGTDPDEGIHLVQIWCGSNGESGRCPLASSDTQTQLVPFRYVSGMNCSVRNFDYWSDASCQNVQDQSELIETEILEYGHYPAPLKNLQGRFMLGDPNTSTFLARTFSVLVATLCISVSCFAARRNFLKIWLFLLICANPFVLSLIASVNPSSWAISSAVGAGILLLGLSLDDFRTDSHFNRLILLVPISLISLVAVFSRPEIQYVAKTAVLVLGIGLLAKIVVGMKSLLIRPLLIATVLVLGSLGILHLLPQWRSFLNFPGVDSQWGSLSLLRDNIFSAPSFALTSLFGDTQGSYATALTPTVHLYLLATATAMLLFGCRYASWTFRQVIRISLAMLSFFIAVLLVHQIIGQPIGGVIQPRYFTPLAIILLATTLRSIPLSVSGFVVRIVTGALVFSAFIYIPHNLMRYVSGVSPTHNIQSVWQFIVLSDSTQLWWQDILRPLSPQLAFTVGWLAFVRVAAIGETLTRKTSSSE